MGYGKKKVTAVAILDLFAAFDTLDNKLLLEALQKRFGICDMALLWYEIYFRPCLMKVCINGKYSSSNSLAYSVPQGSYSGANSSTVYCNLIIDSIPNDHAKNGFADGHSIHKVFNPSLVNHEVQTIARLEET